MRFGPDILEEIKSRLAMSQVAGRRVKLKKQGREYVGLSPFNVEKTPSFFVNDQKAFYHDFSSGKSGDIFTFLMETEGLSFPEAVERLANEAGVKLPTESVELREFTAKRVNVLDAVEVACAFFEQCLASDAGADARLYLKRRGVLQTTVREFRLGYAPASRTALRDFLKSKGISIELAVEAGLLVAPENGDAPYDRFRERLIIPIHDLRGRVVGFGGRALDPDGKPKYLNSPETALFKKSELLFNAHRAREDAHKQQKLVLVEGYMDAIALYQAGFKPVVAALGTAFNEAHIQNLWRLAPEPTICFDGDRAGLAAAHRSVDRILPDLKEGKSFWFSFVPDGKDPDEFISERGLPAFLKLLDDSRPLNDVLWSRELERWPVNTPERMAGFEARIREAIQSIREPAVRRRYELHFRVRLSSFFFQLERDKNRRERAAPPAPSRTMDISKLEMIVLGMLVEFPYLFEAHLEKIMVNCQMSGNFEIFKDELYKILEREENISPIVFYNKIKPEFYLLLDQVHGAENKEKGLRLGHRLLARFPILKHHPPENFIERSLLMFIEKVQLKRATEELNELNEVFGRDMTAENETRVLACIRGIQERSDHIHREEVLLDELARTYRSYGGQPGHMAAA